MRNRLLVLTCLLPFVARPLAAQSSGQPLQLLHDSLLVDGHYRTFHYLKPSRPNATLIFVLHGSGGNGQQIRLGYQQTPVKTLLPDTDPNDGKTVEQYTFSKPGKPEVTLLKVLGGGHNYPNNIDVYLTAWAFFKRPL